MGSSQTGVSVEGGRDGKVRGDGALVEGRAGQEVFWEGQMAIGMFQAPGKEPAEKWI